VVTADGTPVGCTHANCRNIVTDDLQLLHHNWTLERTNLDSFKSFDPAAHSGHRETFGRGYRERDISRPSSTDLERHLLPSRYRKSLVANCDVLPSDDYVVDNNDTIDAAQLCREIDTLFFDGGVI